MADRIVQLQDKDGNNVFPVSTGGETLPVGSEIEYDGSTVPTGWQEIDDRFVYSAGDVVDLTPAQTTSQAYFVITSGYVTSGAKQIGFNIPLPKSAVGLTATITGSIWVRSVAGGYVLNGTAFSSLNVTTVPLANNSLGVQLENTDNSAFNVANNTPVSVGISVTVTFS